MSFRTSLSGMNAANADLNVTANNIANVNTTGFKESRAEFGDVFAVSPYGLARNAIGAGAKLTNVAQQFSQGNIDFTDRSLDMAISGEGFFTVADSSGLAYTRAGNFQTDNNGFVVTPTGQRLQVFPATADGTIETGRLADLQISTSDAPPRATDTVTLATTLPANAEAPVVTPFDPSNSKSFNKSTSLTVYDSLGVAHVQSFYYVKTDAPNTWELHTAIDGNIVGGATTLEYDESGALVAPADGEIALAGYQPANGAAMNLTLDVSDSAQYGEAFSVNGLSQNGYAMGRLSGIEIGQDGTAYARYSNGSSRALGQVAMTQFVNPQGLQALGDNLWAESSEAGTPRRGTAGSSDFGLVESGALEASNVDLTEQLVNMITAQRNFQANAQMVSTQDQITQSVINIR
ncbi:flagellar hook protein FlgE [Coralloluteibacterium stylophorae]|uniref:Flagellar hook protein FlgE n=1 Tax=Coralloluteibacterium stylophorae TaxID=1776034 RepID=A0A8J7VW57_9GAMM|nr:flagellar hook protein FlgE [Coralloluteibacterium stylophorae]MBS7457197.1 flagellar hook protein FlgE [Coralloluteibacterium stylophorae]